MRLFLKIIEIFKSFKKPALSIYPIVIIICIPALLIINTVWNLKSFNRDANFIVRHQAVSITETLKPIISEKLGSNAEIRVFLNNIVNSNEDVLSMTILKEEKGNFFVFLSTKDYSQQTVDTSDLNMLAKGTNQPIAGLIYEPALAKNVWSVISPLYQDDSGNYFLNIILDTKSISEILSRTSKDSIIVLIIMVLVIIILLTNHFVFYLKSLRTQQLEELDKLKDEFISIAAHELRAPITALIGYLEFLKDKISPAEVEKIKPDLEMLNSLIGDLNNLINDLLDVSRIEQGRISLKLSDVNVNEVIENVLKVMLPQANQKGLEFLFTPASIPLIKSDRERLRQVITNLVSNSIKYTLKGGIGITAKLENKFVKVVVKDSGIGIPAEELPKLFSKFHRVKDKQTSEVRGTGLGLWITKKIVELLGGKIYVESIYGTGTSFILNFPIVLG